MRRITMIALMMCCAILGGCQRSGEVEHQAYVLVLGVDRLADGRIGLTARVPKIGKQDAGNSEEGSGGSAYLTFTAAGDGWAAALDALEQVTPRQTNLSHIEMLVASEALAGEAGFPALVNEIVETPHLYATARFVVCEGNAGDFARAGETVIGTRMSSELNAMLDHYAVQGYIPRSSLADVYFAVNGIYGDPVAIHARLESEAESLQKQRFLGAALFSGGRFVRALDARETRLMNLIRGEPSAIQYESDGRAHELTPEDRPKKRVDADWNITLSVSLSTLDDGNRAEIAGIEARLENDIADLIRACQRLGTEPFGFAEAAATRFATVDDWIRYNWHDRFRHAGISVFVTLRSAGS